MQLPFTAADWAGASFDALCLGRHTLIGATQVIVEQQTDYQCGADVP